MGTPSAQTKSNEHPSWRVRLAQGAGVAQGATIWPLVIARVVTISTTTGSTLQGWFA